MSPKMIAFKQGFFALANQSEGENSKADRNAALLAFQNLMREGLAQAKALESASDGSSLERGPDGALLVPHDYQADDELFNKAFELFREYVVVPKCLQPPHVHGGPSQPCAGMA